jgi:hypothetical protein
MVVVQQLVEWEDPLTAAARTAGDTMTPLWAVHDELRVIVDRRLGERGNAVAAPTIPVGNRSVRAGAESEPPQRATRRH